MFFTNINLEIVLILPFFSNILFILTLDRLLSLFILIIYLYRKITNFHVKKLQYNKTENIRFERMIAINYSNFQDYRLRPTGLILFLYIK